MVLLATLAACGSDEAASARIKNIEPGMTREQVFAEMGTGPLTADGADSVRVVNGFRHARYLVDGKQYEVIYARDEAGKVSELLQSSRETPVVLEGDKVLGKGWEFYLKTAMPQLRLPNPLVAVDTAKPGSAAVPKEPTAPDTTKKDSAATAPAPAAPKH